MGSTASHVDGSSNLSTLSTLTPATSVNKRNFGATEPTVQEQLAAAQKKIREIAEDHRRLQFEVTRIRDNMLATMTPEQHTALTNQSVRVFLKTMTGKTITVFAHLNMTVKMLKDIVQRMEGIDSEHQRLLFAGKQMEDDRRLIDYGVREGSDLHLVIRLTGC